MDWQTRRRLLYALATLISMSALTLFLFKDVLFPPPTCFDGQKNGYESGLDCGGTCFLVCKNDVEPLTVPWARAIKVGEGTYDLVALISNKNINNASYATGYTFFVYNQQGDIIGKLMGTTTAPVDGDFPIIKQAVQIPQVPAQVTMILDDTEHYMVQEKPTSPTIRVANERYENIDNVSRVYATIINTKRVSMLNLPVRVILFDEKGNAYAVGETVIPLLDKEAVKEVTFVWNWTLPFSPTRIKVYPIFDPFVAQE